VADLFWPPCLTIISSYDIILTDNLKNYHLIETQVYQIQKIKSNEKKKRKKI